MTVCLVAVVKDEAAILDRCLDESLRRLISSYCVVDTGSSDGTPDKIRSLLAEIPGELHEREWRGYAENVTEAFSLAPREGWLLRLDADMTVDWHEDLPQWLEDGADEKTDAWNVWIQEPTVGYRLPLLLRAGIDWRWSGAVHEYLDTPDVQTRSLLGLTVTHHRDSAASRNPERLAEFLKLLEPGFASGDPRSVFYYAQTLEQMGQTEAAIAVYERRADLAGFEEEAWYAAYRVAVLRADPEALLSVYHRRPWRTEPLRTLLGLTERWEHNDSLFVAVGGGA